VNDNGRFSQLCDFSGAEQPELERSAVSAHARGPSAILFRYANCRLQQAAQKIAGFLSSLNKLAECA